jgi:uncharacterized protein YjbI with pentapeptide repeats
MVANFINEKSLFTPNLRCIRASANSVSAKSISAKVVNANSMSAKVVNANTMNANIVSANSMSANIVSANIMNAFAMSARVVKAMLHYACNHYISNPETFISHISSTVC